MFGRRLEIDVFDLNILVEILNDSEPILVKDSFWVVMFNKIKELFRFLFKKEKYILPKTDVLFFGRSTNNLRSFHTILSNLKDVDYFLIHNNYPFVKSYYRSIPYFFQFIKTYFQSDLDKKKIIRSSFLDYWTIYGKYITAIDIIRKTNPKILFLANDHSALNRCLLSVATKKNIKTVYTQHASVSDKFPRLRFDYSFLDGEESFEKYGSQSKKDSKVILSGASRFDYMFNVTPKKTNKIGVAVNNLDDFNEVKKLCEYLLNNFKDHSIIVRPHPSMKDWNKDWFKSKNIEFSDPSEQSPLDFLSDIFIQISNLSGIHLDASIFKKPTVQFKLSEQMLEDYYFYIGNKLIKVANNLDELSFFIKNSEMLRPNLEVLQYYMASMFKPIEGKVGFFIAEYIALILREDYEEIMSLEKKNDLTVYNY